MCLDAHLHLKELPCPFAVIWGDDWSVNLYKAIVLEEKKVNNKNFFKKNSCSSFFMKLLHWCSHLEIWVNCCSGLTSYPQQGAKSICSAPEMRKLANILKAMSLFDFKGKVLKKKNIKQNTIKLWFLQQPYKQLQNVYEKFVLTTGLHSPTTLICLASSSTGCFWCGLFLRMPVTSTALPNVSNLNLWEKQRIF